MSLGTWEPDSGTSANKLDAKLLQAFAGLSRDVLPGTPGADKPVDDGVLAEKLVDAALAQSQWVMKLPESEWALADSLSADELVALVRLFTLVENRVPGWDAGKDSPVIALVKLLRARDGFEPELRKWIKANTDNRYLPYGSAL